MTRRSHLSALFRGPTDAHEAIEGNVWREALTALGLACYLLAAGGYVPALEALQRPCPPCCPRSAPAGWAVEIAVMAGGSPEEAEDDIFAVVAKRYRERSPTPPLVDLIACYRKGRAVADAVAGIDWPELVKTGSPASP
jgi:hypothetical protein